MLRLLGEVEFLPMEDYPKTLAEFEARFSKEEECREYLARMRWPKGFRCARCGHGKAWPKGRVLFQCSNCGYQSSVTAGTVFDKTRKPLVLWFRAIWWVTSRSSGANALGLQHFLGLRSYQTAWVWLHKLRRAMVRPGRGKLVGAVEAAAVSIRCVSGGSGDGVGGVETLVAIAVEAKARRATGRIRMRRVEDLSRRCLESFVSSSVEPGSKVCTAGRGDFSGLQALGYTHRVATAGAKRTSGDTATARVARVATLLSEWMLSVHQGAVSSEHLDYYLDEFTFRFNRRNVHRHGRLFHRLLRQAVLVEPVAYREMVRNVRVSRRARGTGD